MIKRGLRTCIYKVLDLEAAKKWYNEVFETKPYFDQSFYVGYNIAGYELGLHPESEPIDNKTPNVFTYWGVDDVQFAFDRIISLGATSFEEPADVGDNIIVASVKDPWQNIIGLIYNPNFKLE